MRKRRVLITADDKKSIWAGWHAGKPMSIIALEIDKTAPAVFGVLSKYGGIEPLRRTRSERCLALEEREEISRGLAAGSSLRDRP